MKRSTYFCPEHTQRILESEQTALNQWLSNMRKGITAYIELDPVLAVKNLGAALDVALLRQSANANRFFTLVHIVKPTEFLLELAVQRGTHDFAVDLLRKISSATYGSNHLGRMERSRFLANCYEKISDRYDDGNPQFRLNIGCTASVNSAQRGEINTTQH